jgi:2,5-diamino-6-(ribosylamino)-4(3H)-pyrimidinone 5'-phosphate reductase
MKELPITTLFMLVSADGKISTGSNDGRDFGKDLPSINSVGEGLHQYYDLEKQTDYYSFNTGRVMAKVGWNDEKEKVIQIDVIFVIVDNKPHLTERGLKNLLRFVKKLYVVTTNSEHPAVTVKNDRLEVIRYENKVDLTDLFGKLKSYGAERVTIQSGGEMNADLMRSGLIDFVSLVVAPVMVGGRDTSSLLDGESLKTDDDLRLLRPLELTGVDTLDGSYLHLRYKVINNGLS